VIGYVIEALGYDVNVIRTEVDLSSLGDSQLFNEPGARLAPRHRGNVNEPTYSAIARAVMEKDVARQDTDAAVHQLHDPVKELERLDEESQGHRDPQPPTSEELVDLTKAAAKRRKPKAGE